MLSKLFQKKSAETNLSDYVFDFEPESLRVGKKSIQEMSLIQAQFNDYVVTKTGYLVGALKVSGINVDLLNENEAEDLFDDYNSFLMSVLGENTGEIQQYFDLTTPVNFNEYLLYWKKRYLEVLENEPDNTAKIRLIASYVDTYQKYKETSEMTTKTHVVVLKQKIERNNLPSLEKASDSLDDNIHSYIRNLENTLKGYEIEVRKLTAQEYLRILRQMMNNSQH